MTRPLFIVCLVVLWFVGCERSNDPPPPTPATTAAPKEQPPPPPPDLVVDRLLMWEVAPSDKPETKSYLVGTYHIGTDFHGLGELPSAGRAAFEASRLVVLEADHGVVDPELDELLVLQGPKTLETMLTPEHWEAALEQTGLPPQKLARLRPHVVLAELSRKWNPEAGVRGMDGRFRILAKAHEKRLAFIETPREQLEMLSEAVTVEILSATLDEAAEEEARAARLLAAFRAGDEARLVTELYPPGHAENHADFYHQVVWKRNAAWVERLTPWLDEGGAFVAVGASHLLGEKNLRTMLVKAGYSVSDAER